MTAWHEEPISRKHDRDAFDCGDEALNEFLRRYARKSHDLGGAKTFLAMDDADGKTILGFYSLSPASIYYSRTPEIVRRGLARHDVPGFRLARLAVDRKEQRAGERGEQRYFRVAEFRQFPAPEFRVTDHSTIGSQSRTDWRMLKKDSYASVH